MYETVCNTYESTTLPLPNRMVQPRESWPARIPMFVLARGKRQLQDIFVTCTYEGVHATADGLEAYIALSGVVKGRGARSSLSLGKARGHARFNVEKGFLTLVHLTVRCEVENEDAGVRLLVTDQSIVRRQQGNQLGIAAAIRNQPGAPPIRPQPASPPTPPPAVAGPVQPTKPAPPPASVSRPAQTPKDGELTKLLADLKSADEATRHRAAESAKSAGLLAYWSFDEGEGERAKDASSNGLHAKLVNAGWTEGVRGRALRLTGKDSYLDYGDSPRLSFAARAPFSIAFWTRTTRAKGTLLSQRHSRDGGAIIDLLIVDGKVKAQVRQDGNDIFGPTEVISGTINDGKWHHLALTRDGDRIELFLDGVSQGQKSGNLSGGAISTDLRALGAERYWRSHFAFGDPHFEGDMDEFCIFDRVLKANEIAALTPH